MKRISAIPVALAFALLAAASVLGAQSTKDVLVSNSSPPTPFAQNKQNEPTITADANNPSVLVAGSNDEIDMEDCNAGDPTRCPFTPGVGVSGVYFSFDSGKSWTQPTYTGWTARQCYNPKTPGYACTPAFGPIGTLPWYYENGLVSDGDPAVAFGPRLGANGFSWANGDRLYYANLVSKFDASRIEGAFMGFEAIGVSRSDDVSAAAASDKNAWMQPVIISAQSQTTFSDKEQIWADNAASSPFFGNVYVCWASYTGNGHDGSAQPTVAVSSDGGDTWTQHPIGGAANNSQVNPVDGCTVRTDSKGNAYEFGIATSSSGGHQSFEFMSVSNDGGKSWSTARPVVGPVTQPGVFDPVLGRTTIDGIAGARSDLAPAPSVDIANGAPTGADATDRLVMTYVSGSPVNTQHVYFTESTDAGATWSAPRAIESSGDHGYYSAAAISPNGTDAYVVYNAFTTPYRDNTTDPRNLVGVVLHATVSSGGTGAFTQLHRGANGDPRGSSQNNLVGEFLGDYVYATATRTYGAGVWNDARNAADCPAIDAWRMSLRNGTTVQRPAPEQDCPANFGNSDIYGFSSAP